MITIKKADMSLDTASRLYELGIIVTIDNDKIQLEKED